jgi:peptidoglycan/LPS O-acetylase OafA/YrhL
MRTAVNPLWFMLLMSAAIGASCASFALPTGWPRIVVCCTLIAGELAMLALWNVRVRDSRVRTRWTRPGVGMACAVGVVALVVFLVWFDGSLWTAVVGIAVWIVLSLCFLTLNRVESRKRSVGE